ncbi:UNVERIFIED_ORG: hypothetical protein JN05_00818 [Zoogloea ramigera]|uniref:Zinc ribbon domain-containing protein n=1 Tax=Duganella zoogloeoides TaxID=75659 RepID=A0ABZ0XTE9_9BURK|nr:zinc ribbon domain-containing protein [Duganella zoogloeoides]WQH02998.1 zinc ribbon domain-containing protein [Duganella zoogloeoides]
MFATLAQAIKSRWLRLITYSGAKRLSWFALILVFALDGFTLTLMFKGLTDAEELVNYPSSHVSNDCTSLSFNLLRSSTAEQIATLASAAEGVGQQTRQNHDLHQINQILLPICVQIQEKMLVTIGTPPIIRLAEHLKQIDEQISRANEESRKIKESYSTALLEKIADQKREESILPVEAGKIKSTVDYLTSRLAMLEQRHAEVSSEIVNHPNVLAYFVYLKSLPIDSEFAKEAERYERQVFWYPLKVVAAQVGFMVPLLLMTIFWNARAIRKSQETSILISAHLILVCTIPILLRLLYFIGDLLPQELLYRLLYVLQEWKLSFLWYYLAIAASVAGGLFLVYLAQRSLFTAARQRLTRLRKTQCRSCGEKLRLVDQACCEMCGASQRAPCDACGQPRQLLAFHCNHCGTATPAPT